MAATRSMSEWCLDQLADLIRREGSDRFLASPIIGPTPQCFPDPWTPDVAGARRVALRLMSYAGLDEFDVQLERFSTEAWHPARVLDSQSPPIAAGRHAVALFAGIEEGVCYFGVADRHLGSPEILVAALSHEVAHAWRRTKGLETGDEATEEYLTDLTTVYLGFGILTCNAAYRYRSGSLFRTSYYSHDSTGYLGPEWLCYLLAIQCRTRDEDPEGIRGLLEPTQADLFGRAHEMLDREQLAARLSLPSLDGSPPPVVATPGPLRESLGQVERRVKGLVEREASAVHPETGLFYTPVRCDFVAEQTRARGLFVWGYFGIGAKRWASLHLIEVPERADRLLVMESEGTGGLETVALGLLGDAIVSNRKRLVEALKRLFATNGYPEARLLTELPAYLLWTTQAGLHLGDLKDILWIGAEHLNLDRLGECVEALELYAEDIWERDGIAGKPLPCPVTDRRGETPSSLTRAMLKRWWTLATDTDLSEEKAGRVEALAATRGTS